MSDRAYTVAEIDRMREAVRRELASVARLRIAAGQWNRPTPAHYEVDAMLRTYMLAGVAPEELE